jgi:hypothetical protein
MSHFIGKLTVTKVADMIWMTEEPFAFESGIDLIKVEDCFLTDFASVPRIFWIILPPDGQYTQAAVLHDFLYQKCIRSRKQSDDLFLEGMKVLNVPAWKRNVMYWAVRFFGFNAYGRVQRLEDENG